MYKIYVYDIKVVGEPLKNIIYWFEVGNVQN